MAKALLKNVRDIFLGPSVYRHDAAADAVQHAIRVGKVLARDIRSDLLSAAFKAKIDISAALDIPIAAITGGIRNTEHGSLLETASVGAVAAVGIEELYRSGVAKSQDRVLHSMVARSIAAWEVGEENIGQAPSPWQGGMHFQWSPGTLVGGKVSISNKLMEDVINRAGRTRTDTARYIAQFIISSLWLAEDPCMYPKECSILYKLGLDRRQQVLPEEAIDAVAKRILAIDPFWPSYLTGKEVIC